MMTSGRLPACLLIWVLHVGAASLAAQTLPTVDTQPATMTGAAPAVESSVDKLLSVLEEAGRRYTTLTAELEYVQDEPYMGVKDTYEGWVYYQKDPEGRRPTRFRIHFDTVQRTTEGRPGPKSKEVKDYVFDGFYFTLRQERVKEMTRYQVAEPGKPVDALELGKGPFPVPFGQKKENVLRLFEVTSRQIKTGDMPSTQYLLLKPKPEGDLAQFKQIELWVNEQGLPARMRSEDAVGQKITTVTFRKIKTDAKLADKDFDLPVPPRDWTYKQEPLRADTQIKP